jgi:arylsulfatase A-like enzyme
MMNRFLYSVRLVTVGLVVLAVFACTQNPKGGSPGSGADLAGSRPNILLVMADDMDAADLGCYGAEHISTPNLDELARTGIQFRTAYATSLCGPTRSMLLSGKYATRTGHWCNWSYFNTGSVDPLTDETFYSILHEVGYRTVVAGKWSWDKPRPVHFDESCIYARTIDHLPAGAVYDGYVSDDPLWKAGARYWYPLVLQNGEHLPTTDKDYGPEIFCDYLVDFMKRHSDGGQPLLMYYPMVIPHAEDARKSEQMGFPPTPDPEHPGRTIDGGYDGMKAYVDVLMGRLVDGLEKAGIRDNTLVIFTTDNGSYGPRGKGTTCEPGSWVPFIVNCPGMIPAGGPVDEMASLADILPTFAELAGAEYSGEIDGISFIPVLEGKPGKRDHLFSYLGSEVILRDRRWLLEHNYDEEDPGIFWDCGTITAGNCKEDPSRYYRNVTGSDDPEVLAAKERFMDLLGRYEVPEGIPRTWKERREYQLKHQDSKIKK